MVNRRYPTQPIVGVGAIVLQNGKLLLEQRGNEPARGQWTIPGGVVEVGESLETAVVRETKEETGLDVEVVGLIDVVDQVHYDRENRVEYHFVIVDYVVKVVAGTAKASSDAADLRWVAFNDVERYDLTPSFRRFFKVNRSKLESFV